MKSVFILGSCLLVEVAVCAQTFSTGSPTNTVPGSLNVTGALTVNGTPVSTNSVVTTNFVQKTGDTMTGTLTNNAGFSITNDVLLVRDSANTLALKNSTTAQFLNLYYTFTDSANYSRLSLKTGGNAYVETEGAGSGAPANLLIGTGSGAGGNGLYIVNNGGLYWLFTLGEMQPVTDNSVDIGDATHKVRKVFIGTSLLLGTNVLSFSGTNLTFNGGTVQVTYP